MVPPDTGIVHQVNLEYLARVIFKEQVDGRLLAYPDTLVGTDSHTTMVNGLGVVGWGVGGIEAEAAMLGQPISMLIPEVIGFRLVDRLPEGAVDAPGTRASSWCHRLLAVLDTGLPLAYQLPRLRHWVTSGETLPIELARRFADAVPDGVLLNLYGSSEVSADATWFDCRESSSLPSIPIGRPIANSTAYVLDPDGQPGPCRSACPASCASAATGWPRVLDVPLTAERFVADPFPPAADVPQRRSRTVPADGAIEFLGRRDQQVKVRGFRSSSARSPRRSSASPESRQLPRWQGADDQIPGDKRLIAYVVRISRLPGSRFKQVVDDWEHEQIPGIWRSSSVPEQTYQQVASPADPTFNIAGWNSSYTGTPIPPAEMREWSTTRSTVCRQ